MFRLDPKDLPPHLQEQVFKKLSEWDNRSKVELAPSKTRYGNKAKEKGTCYKNLKISC